MDKSSRALLTVQSIANSHLISVFIWQGEKCDGAFEWSPGISTILHRFLLTAYHLLWKHNHIITNWNCVHILQNCSNKSQAKSHVFHVYGVGIGNPPGTMDMKAYLLQKFSDTERKQVFVLRDAWQSTILSSCYLSKYHSSYLIMKGIPMDGSSCLLNFIIVYIPLFSL